MLQPNLDQETILRRNHEAKVVRRVVLLVLAILIFSIIGLGIGGYVYIKGALEPVDASSKKPIEVEIPIGTSTSEIANKLEEKGVIKSALVFKYYVKYKNDNDFQAGNYELTKAMEMKDIILSLKDGKVYKEPEMTVRIAEGLRIPQVASKIAEQTEYTEDEVLKKMQDKKYIQSLVEKYPVLGDEILDEKVIWPLEGYLFPATYEFFKKDPSLESIIESMVSKMSTVVTKYQANIEASGYTTHEILTLASIIEEEAKEKEDRFKVSGVFHNRLNKPMRLQSDVTVTYAQQQSKITVTYKDTETNSPYNTYVQKGLPIGPISSPGDSAINAAVNPEPNPNYYFFARPNGEVLYAKTLDEHNVIKEKYIQEWRDLANKDKD
ncbi:endolytic transglycosylase MltG [Pseudalkalibacillus berkeleyi]|uniref:Endolytic murein transglycosylase n=1 Tax=Pseudalkalibacillus berkeleyi TaxID=1069813 RepID=A0ABS9H315_9BACL|nr:endolytic transglycosylase MltG [Pseudalkalibacillus berkeleyi]MCF6138040.1 endolytic transglycosylase MltG [Pseudalkalibacillus berkeleyi]